MASILPIPNPNNHAAKIFKIGNKREAHPSTNPGKITAGKTGIKE
jgi:hypothetical protein